MNSSIRPVWNFLSWRKSDATRTVRFLTWAVFGLAWAASLSAQEKKAASTVSLTVSADQADALYQRGETVTFEVTSKSGGEPVSGLLVNWTIAVNGAPPTQTGKVTTLENGKAAITAKLDEPGFLLCRVTLDTDQKKSALAGAGIEPEKIAASRPVPDDFDEFWREQKQKLVPVPMNPQLTPVKALVAGVDCFDLKLSATEAPVSGYFARPHGAAPKSLPAILTVHGAGVRSANQGETERWASQPLLALDINAHGLPNGQPAKFYQDLAAGELADYRPRGRESRDTIYFRAMILRVVRAIDFLTSQPEWDGKTVIVYGSSQGGFQAIAAAGLDSRVTFIAAGIPAGCDHTGVLVGRASGWPKYLKAGSDGQFDPKVVEAVRYYDAVNFATRAKAAAVFTVGFIDTTCPPSSVYAAFNQYAGGPKQMVNLIRSGHGTTREGTEGMQSAVMRYLGRDVEAGLEKLRRDGPNAKPEALTN